MLLREDGPDGVLSPGGQGPAGPVNIVLGEENDEVLKEDANATKLTPTQVDIDKQGDATMFGDVSALIDDLEEGPYQRPAEDIQTEALLKARKNSEEDVFKDEMASLQGSIDPQYGVGTTPAKQYAQSRKDDVFLERIADVDDQQKKPMTVGLNQINDGQAVINEFLLDEDEIGGETDGEGAITVRDSIAGAL